jgi:nitroreductase
MEAIECLRTRRSIRQYDDRPVSRDQIETIVDCGRLAPTGRNEQPWEFVVITDADLRARLAEITDFGPFIATAPVCVVVLCQDTKYYIEDGSAALTNMLNAAHALGLGACWVAGDKKPYAGQIRELAGAPDGYLLVGLMSLGYAASGTNAPKRPLKEVLHWERLGGTAKKTDTE